MSAMLREPALLKQLKEQAETHARELRAYEATVANLNERIRQMEAERVPEGYVLVQQSIHPIDCVDGDKVVQLLANAPDAGPFDNPQDFYQFWWQQLLFAAAPAQEKV